MKSIREITINRLTLDHFKGCGHLELRPEGRSVNILGDNASGKTTVYDAFTWLLFGKDSLGQGDFEILPLGPDGSVADHGAVASVEAEILVDGEPITLQRTWHEKWTRRRGAAEASFDGRVSEFYVNGVPKQKKEFEAVRNELIGEELFKVLTDVFYFCEKLDWKKRREFLLKLCALPSDQELLKAEPESFGELAAALGNLGADEFKATLLAKRKKLNGARDSIPARMDEHQKLIQDYSGINFPSLRGSLEQKNQKLDSLRAELIRLDQGGETVRVRNEIARVNNCLRELENRNRAHRMEQQTALPRDDGPMLREELRRAAANRDSLQQERDSLEKRVIAAEAEAEQLRGAWYAATEEPAPGNWNICPTCGQPLPKELEEAARERAEAEKAAQLDRIASAGSAAASRAAQQRERLQALDVELSAAKERADAAQRALADYVPPEPGIVSDLPEYAERTAELNAEAAELQKQLSLLEADTANVKEAVRKEAAQVRAEADALERELAKEQQLSLAQERLEVLREEARKGAEEMEQLDRLLNACDNFTRYKTRFIDAAVNGRFSMARFKLFDQQVNGMIADCCEAVYQGVPWRSVNKSAQMNIGMDVIRTLGEYYGVRVPLFIDNAESVTKIADAGTQVILMTVLNPVMSRHVDRNEVETDYAADGMTVVWMDETEKG